MTSRPTPVKRYHDYLLQTVNDLNVINKWFVSPLNLGGVPGEDGGSGVPLAGVVGQLIQSNVAYDTTEATSLSVPASGQSLVHNLNRIRYWLDLKSNEVVVLDEGIEVASGVRVLDFIGAPVTVTLASGYSDRVLVTISGIGESASGILVAVSANDTTPNYLENKLTAGSSKITVTTANPGGNEERQVDLGTVNINDLNDVTITTPIDNHVLSYDSGGFINQTIASAGIAGIIHTHLEDDITDLDHDAVKIQGTPVNSDSPENDDILIYTDGEWIPSGLSAGTANLIVQEDDVETASGVTILNFEGAVTTLYEGSNKVTITVSGVSGSGIAGIDIEEAGTPKVTDATILNFVSGATIIDAGGGQANITVSGGGGGGTGDFTTWMPDAPPASGYSTVSTSDDEFDDISFDTSIWTVYDEGSRQTETENEYGLTLTQSGTDYFQGIFQPVPSGVSDWSFTIYVGQQYGQADNGVVGIMLLEDISNLSTSDVFVWGTYRGGSGFGHRWAKAPQYNSYTGDGSWINDNKDFAYYLRLRTNGTTWYFDLSTDGYDWLHNMYTQAVEFTPEGIGLGYRLASTSWVVNAKFARFKADSSASQMLYGDRVDMWRAS